MSPKQPEQSVRSRDRGRILTPEALAKLQQAIRVWEVRHEKRCTQERIRELTSEVKEGGLDPSTTRKILKAKDGVDPESIRCLFIAFGLELLETDLVASTRFLSQTDPNFVGREGAIADLNTLVNRGVRVIVIQARGGVGKTTLARKYLQQAFGSFLEFPIAKETKDIASIESLIEEKLRQLGEEPGREFFVSLDRLKRKLQTERIGILIDNLEPALDSNGKFIEGHRRYVELLRVLADPLVRSVTLITTRERLRESSITTQHYSLRNLSVLDWQQLFLSRGLNSETPVLVDLHNAYGGNAKAMDIICGVVVEDYSSSVEAYWQANHEDLFIERDLEDLVTQQLNRLQEAEPDAYKLLCRMGCYRYQDVPRVPIEGLLCLLWDVPEGQRRRVVKSLQDRSLVDIENEEYRLHPVIRAVAVDRLNSSPDREIVNRTIAIFWTDSIEKIESAEDVLKAIEASYFYTAVDDIERACAVITQERDNSCLMREELFSSAYRLGCFQPIISLIVKILTHWEKIKPREESQVITTLHHTLADFYWMTGRIHDAIEMYKIANKMAKRLCQEKYKIICLINLVICKIDLGEFEEALRFSLRAVKLAEESIFLRYKLYSSVFTAFLYSDSGNREEAIRLIEMAEEHLAEMRSNQEAEDFRCRLTAWGKGYMLFFMGEIYKKLGIIEEARKKYNEAFKFSEDIKYDQVKAKILYGIGGLYRYEGKFNVAVERTRTAVEILKRIGAQCDLAKAYHQLGLSYLAIGDLDASDENFQAAIQLFTEIGAPKQVERVSRSINRCL